MKRLPVARAANQWCCVLTRIDVLADQNNREAKQLADDAICEMFRFALVFFDGYIE